MNAAAQTQTLVIERILDATPEEVWAAWTEADQYVKWISPFPGRDVELHEFDVRVGGRVRFTMTGTKGERYPEASFVYEKLDRPREIVTFEANENRPDVFDGHPMRATTRFEPVPGGKTRVVFRQEGLPAAIPLDMARQGFGSCFDKLADLLATRKASPQGRDPVPTLRLERTFDATPQEIWNAWTDPKQYAKWFNPSGIELVIRKFDVRPGGEVEFDMPQPDGNLNPQSGVFHVVSPYTELSSGAPDKSFLVTTRFEPQGPRTRVVVEMVGVPPEHHQPATVGWGMIFDRLGALLASRK